MMRKNFVLDGAAAVVLSLTRRAGRKTYITYPPFKRSMRWRHYS